MLNVADGNSSIKLVAWSSVAKAPGDSAIHRNAWAVNGWNTYSWLRLHQFLKF